MTSVLSRAWVARSIQANRTNCAQAVRLSLALRNWQPIAAQSAANAWRLKTGPHPCAPTSGRGEGASFIIGKDQLLARGGKAIQLQDAYAPTSNWYLQNGGGNFLIRSDQNVGAYFGVAGGYQFSVQADGVHVTGAGAFSGALSASNLSGTNSGDQFTNVAAAKLIGRGSGGGAGAAQELALGAGLAMAGTTLSTVFTGAMAKKAADETTANYASTTAIPWTAEDYDTDGFHDIAANTSRLTLPNLTAAYGKRAKKVSLRAYVSLSAISAAEPVSLTINKNGAAAVGLPFIQTPVPTGSTAIGIEAVAHNIPVLGDGSEYFEALLDAGADTSVTINSNRSCFQIWVTEWQA